MTGTLVVIPTYNELDNLPDIIARVHAAVPDAEVLVVDDASPDGTGDLADRLAAADPRINVLHRADKEGLGAAYRAGFAWGLARDYDRLVEMDADGSHDPAHLPALLAALAHADVALGSRWVEGGRTEGWPLSRRLLSRGGSAYARFMLGLSERDVTGGYRAYRAGALRAIDPGRIDSQGYSFQIEMLWRASTTGQRVVEVPITFVERVHGASKMSSRIVIEAMARVTTWGLQRPLVHQILAFLVVGGVGFVVDVATFNLLRLTVLSPDHVHGGALIAKAVSTTLAIAANWIGNRYWTFRDRRRTDVAREGIEFLLASALGGLVALFTLGVSHYVLGLRTPLADNISANVIGLALASAVRFVAYRQWVYAHPKPTTPAVLAATTEP
ncbi:glycosyltransferase [Microbacterium sp. B2969]|uniref:Glycosyltransferase n=1 Tax=Microbacterium alkaliflavum TaxID=3248839 RepID=A0ABW7QDE3_9MICO